MQAYFNLKQVLGHGKFYPGVGVLYISVDFCILYQATFLSNTKIWIVSGPVRMQYKNLYLDHSGFDPIQKFGLYPASF